MKTVLVALLASILVVPAASAQQERQKVAARTGELVSPDQELGRSFRLTPNDLPPPKDTRAVSNGPRALQFKGQAPKVPEGFTATLFAKLKHPRRMLVLRNGDVVVAEQRVGRLTFLRAGPDGKAEVIERHAEGFNQPYGLAWRDGQILVADQDGIWQVPHKLGDARARHGQKAADVPPNRRKPSFNFRQRT